MLLALLQDLLGCPLVFDYSSHVGFLCEEFAKTRYLVNIPAECFTHGLIPVLAYFGVAIAVLRDDFVVGLFPTIRESINNLLIVDVGYWQGINSA